MPAALGAAKKNIYGGGEGNPFPSLQGSWAGDRQGREIIQILIKFSIKSSKS